MIGWRSARAAILCGSMLVLLLPLLMLGAAYGYERWIVWRYHDRLAQLAAAALVRGPDAFAVLSRQGGAAIRLIDPQGRAAPFGPDDGSAVGHSLIGGLAERLLGDEGPQSEHLDEVDRAFPAPGDRDEVRRALSGEAAFAQRNSPRGQMVVFALAVPRPAGGAIYVMKASRRGLRRLLVLRHELIKLLLYQVPFVLVLALSLSHFLVRPLRRLALAARRYPSQPLADERLLSRRDEIGELARAMTALAADLEQRRRATADLGADIAHEFKNPLAIIAASVEFLGQDARTEDQVSMVSELILGSVDRLRRSLDAMLSLLRMEAALPGEAREWVDYHAFLDRLLDEYRRDPRHASFHVRLEWADGAGRVLINPGRWAELLRNLLDNALLQPAERQEVLLQVRREGTAIVTAVRDFGPGISAGNREQIFRRFFTQRPPGAPAGTGLGLSIVQAIAEAHGGRVAVDSQPGQGATFSVTLPCQP